MKKLPKYLCEYSSCGPGGYNCACCYPAPGKSRKVEIRRAKRAEKQAVVKYVSDELD